MKHSELSDAIAHAAKVVAPLLIGSLTVLAGCAGGSEDAVPSSPGYAIAKVTSCAPGDRPEAGLQGQVPMSERTAGFQGYNCNLTVASSVVPSRGTTMYEQFVTVKDRAGHVCGFQGSAPPFLNMGKLGTVVVDMTDPNNLVETAILSTPAMLGPGEGIRAHAGRGLLVAAHYNPSPGTTAESHGFDIYDVGTDCRYPQLLSTTVNIPIDTSALPGFPGEGKFPNPDPAYGHEGAISPDGLTYYISDFPHGLYHAMDISDPTQPKLIASFQPPSQVWISQTNFQGGVHGLSVSNDGNRVYFTTGALNTADVVNPQTGEWHNGFLIVDSSEVQARTPNAKLKLISEVNYHDNGAEQMTLPLRIKGKQYLLSAGESGAAPATNSKLLACAAGLTPFGTARIYNIDDEKNPKLASQLVLEVNDPKNCAAVSEMSTLYRSTLFLYDSHMCSVDNRDDATTLVCSHFQSGIRVFDIRDPYNVREIAYFNPPFAAATPGTFLPVCGALSTLDAEKGMLYSACSGGAGAFALKFAEGVWPFPGATTPQDKQL